MLIRNFWRWVKRTVAVGANVQFGKDFHIGIGSFISASKGLTIGNEVYVGKYCTIQCNGTIGDYVLIANNVGIVGRIDHDYRQVGIPVRLSTWIGDSEDLALDPRSWIDIGSDSWIGYGAILLSGIKVGRGAIVAAGSVVIYDVAPYDIVSGNPAKTVGRRFESSDMVREHEEALLSRRPFLTKP